MARQTKEKAEQTREAILDAAVQVFHDRGVTRSTLEEVASTAGVTRGAVYWHFRDKLDLFLAIEDRVILPQEELLATLANDQLDDPISALERSLLCTFNYFATDERRRRELTVLYVRCEYVNEMAPALERQTRAQRNFGSTLNRIFARSVAVGQLAPEWTPDCAALCFQMLVHGVLMRWLRNPGDFELLEQGVKAARALLAAFRGAPPPEPAGSTIRV